MKEFIDRWESLDSMSYKTIIRTKFFDNSNEFIWWDIRPIGVTASYVRFSYQYTKPEQILTGLDKLLTVYKFVTLNFTFQKIQRIFLKYCQFLLLFHVIFLHDQLLS